MLAGHSALFCPPELNLLEFQTMSDREVKLGPCQATVCSERGCDQRHGLQRALMELQGSDDISSRETLDAMLRRDEEIAVVYHVLMELAAPRRLVDKSPSYTNRLEVLQRAESLFPHARYIYLYRNPHAVVESLLRNGFEPTNVRAEKVWTNANNNVQAFLLTVDPARQVRVAYELLVNEPERVTRNLCTFLEVEFQQSVLTPYQGTRMTDGTQSEVAAPGDPNFQFHQDIDAQIADAWREIDFQSLSTEARDLAAKLSYDLP
jgi:Sulfotransferase family